MTTTSFGSPSRIDIGRSGALRFSDSALVADHRLLSTVDPWIALQGNPVEQVYYTTADSRRRRRHPACPAAFRPRGRRTLDRQMALRFFLDHATTFEVDGHVAAAGVVLGRPGYVMATWIAGDHIVTVSGTMSVPQLIAMARTVHQVSADEWQGMQFQAANNGGNNNFGDYEETQSMPVSFGTDAEAEPWTIRAAIATFGEPADRSTGSGTAMDSASDVDSTAKINTVVDSRRTYVLADLPRAIAATAELHIARDGLDPVIVPFNDIDPSLDRTFAAYAFSEPVQYTAQIIGCRRRRARHLAVVVKDGTGSRDHRDHRRRRRLFGEHAPVETDDSGARHRFASVAVLAGLAVIGSGVIVSAVVVRRDNPDDPDPGAENHGAEILGAGSKATPPSIVQASPIIVSAEYYVADPAPPGFTMYFAEKLAMAGISRFRRQRNRRTVGDRRSHGDHRIVVRSVASAPTTPPAATPTAPSSVRPKSSSSTTRRRARRACRSPRMATTWR